MTEEDRDGHTSLPVNPIPGATLRLERMLGSEGLERLARARVAVFGLGAVGSFAVEALVRSGVGHLRLVDFDEVRASNLNRQLFALASTIGRPKIDAATARVHDINPACDVQTHRVFWCTEEADALLAPPLDCVIDAIDSLNPKLALIEECVKRGIPVVSAMGAANRTDPARVRVTDISETEGCPLARQVRLRLRRRGIKEGVTAIWSSESKRASVLEPCDEAFEKDSTFRGRVRESLPSMAMLPGIFGLTAANFVIWKVLRAAPLDRKPG